MNNFTRRFASLAGVASMALAVARSVKGVSGVKKDMRVE